MMSLSEGISILKKLTFKKGANILWVQGSYFLSKATKKNLHRGMPISVAIEPTTSCNLR